MKEIDDTDPTESESEDRLQHIEDWISAIQVEHGQDLTRLRRRIQHLEAEVADLHPRRRVSRQQATDQDPEWFS